MKNRFIVIFLLLILLLIVLLFQKDSEEEVIDSNLIYIPNFLDEGEYRKILALNKDKDTFKFENFRYAKPLSDEIVYDIFYHPKYLRLIKKKLNIDNINRSEFPIEHRYYEDDSPGMHWHKDLLMYEIPQYEAVYTIRNNTESLTQWKDDEGKLHKKWTEPNSVLIVKASGYEHNVTPPKVGEREILKIIYTQTDKTNQNYQNELNRFRNYYH